MLSAVPFRPSRDGISQGVLSSVDTPVVRWSEYLDAVVAALKGSDGEVVQHLIVLEIEDLRW